MVVIIKTELSMKQGAAFRAIVDELSLALHQLGLEFETKKAGLILQGGREVGRVVSWRPPEEAAVILHSADWEQIDTRIRVRVQPKGPRTRILVEHSGLEKLLHSDHGELLGWLTSQVVAPVFSASSPSKFGDWLTDRAARRPTGAGARRGYRNPTHHRPNFGAILEELALTPNDRLLEVGCGGGALLEDALKTGCSAAAVDHSPEMVRLARRVNVKAIGDGRLEIRESEAEPLPFKDSSFTCAAMTSVLGFLEDPVGVLREIRRTLTPTGKMVVFSTSKEAKGTMAAPEPMASRIHFYEDSELESMALQAGFAEAHVKRPDLSKFLAGSGIPKKHAQSFSKPIGQLLVAKKANP